MNKSKDKLTRSEKINLLEKIRAGEINYTELSEPINFSIIGGLSLSPESYYSVSEMRMNPRPTLYLSKEEFKKWRTEKEEENKYRRNPHKFNIVIRDGILMPEDLRPAKIYTFFEEETENGIVWRESDKGETIQILTDSELKEFVNKIIESNDRRSFFDLEIDRIFKLVRDRTHIDKIRGNP